MNDDLSSFIGRNIEHLKKIVFTLVLILSSFFIHILSNLDNGSKEKFFSKLIPKPPISSFPFMVNFRGHSSQLEKLFIKLVHIKKIFSCNCSYYTATTSTAKMKNLSVPESVTFSGNSTQPWAECWFDDACILDMDYFVKTIAGIKAKGVRPDLVGSIIAHYASKWLPDLSNDDTRKGLSDFEESTDSVTVSWIKKRFFVETLVGILPPEKDSLPCNFLLRLLRTANMVNVEPTYREELEKRISWQLDQASLKELLIPSFSHTCGTLLDIELVSRLVNKFVHLDTEGAKSGAALIKVAKLVDSYLAEAAMDSNLRLSEFAALAGALPSNARASDDGLYRAIDTYLKAHPGVSKQERKGLCRLIDSQKLSPEASLHAAQNERLPVRAVIQVLFSEQTKLNKQLDWSGSFSGTRSPNIGFDPSRARCLSKREVNAQQMEIKKLKEDVLRLQNQCNSMQMQIEKLVDKKKGFFRWKKLGIIPSIKGTLSTVERTEEGEREGEAAIGRQTPMNMKTKLGRGRRKSTS